VQSLKEGETVTETFTVRVTDDFGASADQQVTITITGTNDAPVASDDSTSATEAGGSNDAIAGVNPSGNVLTNDTDVDTPHANLLVASVRTGGTEGAGATGTLGVALAGSYGSLTLNADGSYSYAVNNALVAVQALNAGQTLVEKFNYTVSDGGVTDTAVLTVTIHGANDAPTITSASAFNVAENTTAVTAVTATDPDNMALTYSIVGGADAAKFTIDAATGALAFLTAPNFEAPTDAGANNVYDLIVRASDGSLFDDHAIAVTVTDVAEGPTDIKLTVTAIATDNQLPNNTDIGQFAIPTGGGGSGSGYVFSLLSLTKSDLVSGAVELDVTPDLTVNADGKLTTGNGGNALQSSKVYDLDVQVNDGGNLYHEVFSIITGSSSGDTVNGIVTNGDDLIYGLQGADIIFAGSGDDTVFGQNGNDQIHGGDGNDVLYGGGNNDTFFFDTTLNPQTNVDTIRDFTSGDKISLLKSGSAGVFTTLTGNPGNALSASEFSNNLTPAGAGTGSEKIFYDPGTGNLYYDANAGSHSDAVLFANLTNVNGTHPTPIVASDFVIG
jgi:VCBS repeat-containing protein